MSHPLLKSTATVAGMTLVSRLAGFVRDMIFAQLFGAVWGFDVFIVVLRIPYLMRRLFAEGAFSQAFVPVFSTYYHQHPHNEQQQLLRHVGGLLVLAASCVISFTMIQPSWMIMLFAPGFSHHTEKMKLASQLLTVAMPSLLCIAIAVMIASVLHVHQRFARPAFTPLLLNICLITAALWGRLCSSHEVLHMLAWGLLLGTVLQVVIQLPLLYRCGFKIRLGLNWRHQGVQQWLSGMGPALLGGSIAQLGIWMDTLFASFLPSGSISWLYYADRLMNFPLGVLGVAVSTVALPRLSAHLARNRFLDFSKDLDWGLRWMVVLGVPAACGLFELAEPIITTLFGYRAFTTHDIVMSAKVLKALAIGLPGFMLMKVLSSALYAQRQFKIAAGLSGVVLLINILLNTALMRWGAAGLALATGIAVWFNVCAVWTCLQRSEFYRSSLEGVRLLQVLIATLAMAWVLNNLSYAASQWIRWNAWLRLIHLTWLLMSGILTYIVISLIMIYSIKFLKKGS